MQEGERCMPTISVSNPAAQPAAAQFAIAPSGRRTGSGLGGYSRG